MLAGNADEAVQAAEAGTPWSCLPAEVVFQRKPSAYEANNLIPFEEPPLKVFDPYLRIYFIAGLLIAELHRIRLAPHFTSGLSMLLAIFLFPHSVKLFFPLELHSR